MKQSYGSIAALMLMLHLFLWGWKAAVTPLISISLPFGMKMVSMAGMCILTIAVYCISSARGTNLSLWPKQHLLTAAAVILVSLLTICSTAFCFTQGVQEWLLLLYASVVTPLFEELLFRGHIYAIQQHLHRNTFQIVVVNASLFAVWHLGYIITPLWCGEWMALSKLPVGFLYGLLLAYIRSRTQSTACCILTHGAMNSFFG